MPGCARWVSASASLPCSAWLNALAGCESAPSTKQTVLCASMRSCQKFFRKTTANPALRTRQRTHACLLHAFRPEIPNSQEPAACPPARPQFSLGRFRTLRPKRDLFERGLVIRPTLNTYMLHPLALNLGWEGVSTRFRSPACAPHLRCLFFSPPRLLLRLSCLRRFSAAPPLALGCSCALLEQCDSPQTFETGTGHAEHHDSPLPCIAPDASQAHCVSLNPICGSRRAGRVRRIQRIQPWRRRTCWPARIASTASQRLV
jgi:hypothetical protein